MKPRNRFSILFPAVVFFAAPLAHAQWNGAGVSPGGSGLDISVSGNWTGGLINGNFSSINTAGTYDLVLSSNVTLSALNFDTIASTNTIGFGTLVGGTGYTSAPTASVVTSGSGTGATLTTTVVSGAVATTVMNAHGNGYYSADGLPTISYSGGGGGSGAEQTFTGSLPLGATNFTLNSNVAGEARTINFGGAITPQDRSGSTLTIGEDIILDLTANSTIANSSVGNLNALTTITINGDILSATKDGTQSLTKSYSGTVTFGESSTVSVDGGYSNSAGTSTFNGLVSGTGSMGSTSSGTVNLNNALNSFSGNVSVGSGTSMNTVSFANIGQNSGLGSGNQITVNGTLSLSAASTGINATNRNITTPSGGNPTIKNNSANSAALHFIGGTFTASGTGALRLGGTNGSAVNIFGYDIGSAGTRSVTIGNDTGDTAIWRLTGNNSFTGSVAVSRGALEFASASNLGTGASMTLSNAGGVTLRHVGYGNTTIDKAITYGGASSSNTTTISNNGNGTLNFIGALTASGNNIGKTLTLSGFNTGNNEISGNILRGADGAASGTNLTKAGAGTWILSGENTIGAGPLVSSAVTVGNVTVSNGRLVLDYKTNDVLSLASNVVLGGGTLEIRGKSSGTTTETLGTLTTTADSGFSQLVVNNNGGAGTTLNLGNFSRNNGTLTLFDLSSGGKVVTSAALSAANLIADGSPHWFVRTDNTATGVDYVTKNVSNEIVALAAATPLLATGGSANTNYALTGSHALTGTTTVSTVRVNTTGGGTLNLGANNLVTTSGSLFVGDGNYTVGGTGIIGTSGTNSTTVLNYFGTGTLNLEAKIASGTGTVFLANGAGGLINWNSAANTTGGQQFIGGVIRVGSSSINHTNATTGSGSGVVRIATGAILELQSDFTRDIGSTAGHVQFKGNSGFSAFGGNRNVTLEAGGDLNWGQTDFVSDTLLLGSAYSDSTVNFTNNLNLGTASRVVEVGAGVNSNIDGRLSGVISSTGGGLVKRGTGKLELTNANTYSGETWVQGGELVVNNISGSGTGSGEVRLSASTTLSGHGTISGTVSGSGTIAPGASPGILTVGQINASQGLSFLFEMTALNPTYGVPAASGNDVLRITSVTPFSTALTAGNVITVDFGSMDLNIGDVIYGGIFASTDFSAAIANATFDYVGLDGLSVSRSVVQQSADFGSGLVNGYVTRFEIIPEPSSMLLTGLGISGLLLRRRRA